MNCAFSTQNPEKIANAYLQQLQKELNITGGIQHQIQSGDAGHTSVGTFFKDIGTGLFGTNKSAILFTMVFDLLQPRPMQLQAPMVRQGVGAHGTNMLYRVQLKTKINGEVYLDDKASKNAQFLGDSTLASRLNQQKELLDQANKFARTAGEVGGFKLTAPRLLKIVPNEKGVIILASTFPVMKMLGFKCSLEVNEFLSLVQKIEKALA